MNKITLYHGSPERVEQPLLAKGKLTNDYGQGFYCTENVELASNQIRYQGLTDSITKQFQGLQSVMK